MSITGIGLTALNAAQLGLTTTGHNISNANTPGYHRQQVLQSAQTPLFTGAGFVGQGVKVDTISRAYNRFLDNQVIQTQAQSSQLDTYLAQIKQIDNMLADPNAGLSPQLQGFFTSVNDVSANPASVPSRQSLISGGQAMVASFQGMDQRLQEIRDGVNGQITSSIGLINSYAQQIATLNQRINIAQASTSQPANDLLDQRDQVVAQLNQEVSASVVQQSDGSYNIFIGNGQPLVVGQQAFSLAAVPAADDPQRSVVGLVTPGGNVPLSESAVVGGNLGGLLAFRSESLDSAQNALGRVAIGLAQTFNAQHQLGQDLNGALGGNFFTVPSPTVNPNTNNTTATGKSSTAVSASFANVGLLTTSDYKLVATDALGGFTLTRLSDGATVTPASEGLTISLAAGAAVGESWTIQPTRNGARDIAMAITDPSKVAAAAPIIASATPANTGSGTITPGTVNATPVVPNPAHATTDVNLLQPITITFNGPPNAGTYTVTGTVSGAPAPPTTNVPYTAGSNISYNGWTVQISGAPAAGDTFTIGPNTGGVADNRNATLLSALQTTNTLAGGTTTYQGAYSQLVSQVGNKTNEVTVTGKAQATLLAQTQQAQQSFSGVNLDEEAANLTRYQQAFQAAGQMIQISNNLFSTLLTQLGG